MAQYSTFFIPHGDEGGRQEALNAFLRSHRVLSVERSVFPEGWAFCVEWMDGAAVSPVSAPFGAYQREKIDYMKVLSPEVFSRFSELRKRRKAIADADGVKPFVVMTDAQLAKVAEIEKPTLVDLKKVDGFGEAKAEKYGKRLLEESVEARAEPQSRGEDFRGEAVDGRASTSCEPPNEEPVL